MAVYTIPFSAPFLSTLVIGILDRYGHDPLLLGNAIVLLPTQRGCLNLKVAFRRHHKINPNLTQVVPRIIPLADLEKTPFLPGFIPDLLPPDSPKFQQLGLLSQLIMAYGKKELPLTANKALALAEDLLTLLDEIHTSDVAPESLNDLVGEEFAHHWQITLDFLKIITQYWPIILSEKGFVDSSIRRREHLRLITKEWRPEGPVILAGTTATRPATAELACMIHGLPEGHIVLPGYIPTQDQMPLPPVHPQYTLQQFVKKLGCNSWDVQAWDQRSLNLSPNKLLEQLMAPSLDRIIPLSLTQADLPFKMIECQDVQEESLSIGILIRKILEEARIAGTSRSIAVITPDQELTRRLRADLKRWNIVANCSAGTPLGQTVVGTFLSLVAGIHSKTSALSWLSLLKHPLFYKHLDRAEHLIHVRQFDLYLRKKTTQNKQAFPFVPKDFYESENTVFPDSLKEWYKQILELIEPLTSLSGKLNFQEWLTVLVQTAENICDPDKLWIEADGAGGRQFIDELMPYAGDYPKSSSLQFGALLPQLMNQQSIHEHEGIGSPVLILGALEARQYEADVTILAGLNEGTWPKGISTDPWLNHQMRLKLGLPDPQRRIGLSAHDFCLAFSAAEGKEASTIVKPIYLTRSIKKAGTPTLASRWWLRLETILKANQLECPYDQETPALAQQLNRPSEMVTLEPPCPRPPKRSRPKEYSVTDLELLVRDPYSHYAKRILRLKKIEELNQDLEARDFGQYVHQTLDLYHKKFKAVQDKRGETPSNLTLLNCGKIVFYPIITDPIVQQFWWPRFEQIAAWLQQQWENKSSTEHAYTELECHYKLSLEGEEFLLKTIMDRVELDEAGNASIIDYKTGAIPTQKDIVNGFSPQLPLEALILLKGDCVEEGDCTGSVSFKTTSCSLKTLDYWHLKGGDEGGEIRSLKKVDDLMLVTEQGITDLLDYFINKESAYLSSPWGESVAKNKDYQQLSRLKEWNL